MYIAESIHSVQPLHWRILWSERKTSANLFYITSYIKNKNLSPSHFSLPCVIKKNAKISFIFKYSLLTCRCQRLEFPGFIFSIFLMFLFSFSLYSRRWLSSCYTCMYDYWLNLKFCNSIHLLSFKTTTNSQTKNTQKLNVWYSLADVFNTSKFHHTTLLTWRREHQMIFFLYKKPVFNILSPR